MATEALRDRGAAEQFGIYADLAYNIYGGTNSSPQTTDVFWNPERAESLWRYVAIGHIQAIMLGVWGSFLARRIWPLIGSGVVVTLMHIIYKDANRRGRLRHENSNPGAA